MALFMSNFDIMVLFLRGFCQGYLQNSSKQTVRCQTPDSEIEFDLRSGSAGGTDSRDG